MAEGSSGSRGNGVLLTIAGKEIHQGDLDARLKLSGAWYDALAEISDDAFVTKLAEDKGLSVSDDELQAAFDGFRQDRELQKADDTREWLEAAGLKVEHVESMLEAAILRAKLSDDLVDDGQVEPFYNQNPKDFEFARVSHIVVKDGGAAQELALSSREEGEDFAALAKQHSIDEATRSGGGFLGLITRGDTGELPEEIADRIFASSTGEVIGPFELPSGDHCVVRVEEAGRRPLDDDLRGSVRYALFCGKMSELAEQASS